MGILVTVVSPFVYLIIIKLLSMSSKNANIVFSRTCADQFDVLYEMKAASSSSTSLLNWLVLVLKVMTRIRYPDSLIPAPRMAISVELSGENITSGRFYMTSCGTSITCQRGGSCEEREVPGLCRILIKFFIFFCKTRRLCLRANKLLNCPLGVTFPTYPEQESIEKNVIR